MEGELLKTILEQGLWEGLLVWLLIDIRKESKIREEKLQIVINKNQELILELAEKFNVIEDIKEDVEVIKSNLKKDM